MEAILESMATHTGYLGSSQRLPTVGLPEKALVATFTSHGVAHFAGVTGGPVMAALLFIPGYATYSPQPEFSGHTRRLSENRSRQ